MFVKIVFALVLLVSLATWIQADDDIEVSDVEIDYSNPNRTISGEVEVSDDDENDRGRKRDVDEENRIQEEVKAELDRAVESLKVSAKEREEENENGLLSSSNLEPCGTVDCNHRGTCLGSKRTYICACQLGFSGKNCEDTVCDSARDCNGRGLCLGTTNKLTCLCNLGFTGRRCQTAI